MFPPKTITRSLLMAAIATCSISTFAFPIHSSKSITEKLNTPTSVYKSICNAAQGSSDGGVVLFHIKASMGSGFTPIDNIATATLRKDGSFDPVTIDYRSRYPFIAKQVKSARHPELQIGSYNLKSSILVTPAGDEGGGYAVASDFEVSSFDPVKNGVSSPTITQLKSIIPFVPVGSNVSYKLIDSEQVEDERDGKETVDIYVESCNLPRASLVNEIPKTFPIM